MEAKVQLENLWKLIERNAFSQWGQIRLYLPVGLYFQITCLWKHILKMDSKAKFNQKRSYFRGAVCNFNNNNKKKKIYFFIYLLKRLLCGDTVTWYNLLKNWKKIVFLCLLPVVQVLTHSVSSIHSPVGNNQSEPGRRSYCCQSGLWTCCSHPPPYPLLC